MAMKILIVDDALFMRATLRQALEPLGYEIREAENGRQAVEMVCDWHPDLVTLDIVMPEMDGLQALAEICRSSPGTLVVMVTAVEQRQPMQEAMRLGISDFIVKPFDEARVISAIDRALSRLKPA
jgi:two-component system chemotaxis response regulator CheY